jgi:hypothetical protein
MFVLYPLTAQLSTRSCGCVRSLTLDLAASNKAANLTEVVITQERQRQSGSDPPGRLADCGEKQFPIPHSLRSYHYSYKALLGEAGHMSPFGEASLASQAPL